MAVYHPVELKCPSGHSFKVNLARSVNIERVPEIRTRILNGTFHRVTCEVCGATFSVEKPFNYVDRPRNTVFAVQPRGARSLYKKHSAALAEGSRALPDALSPPENRSLRVVYGLDELREKLVAQDAELDDRTVELLKIFALHDHRFLLEKPGLQLILTAAEDGELTFNAYYHGAPEGYELTFPRETVTEVLAKEQTLRNWVDRNHQDSIFTTEDHWVNFRRWTTRYGSLSRLSDFAEEAREGREVRFLSRSFQDMLKRLPRGKELPNWARQALRDLFNLARTKNRTGRVQGALFELCFDIELEDEWAQNDDDDDIDTIWNLLDSVPIDNAVGNTKLLSIDLAGGGGGSYNWVGGVEMGEDELTDRERFEDTLRHEVGHAVHLLYEDRVNQWLQDAFGWRWYEMVDEETSEAAPDENIDEWVALMGGWSNLSSAHRRDARGYLRQAVGKGESWAPPDPAPVAPVGHPWRKGRFRLRRAYEQSGAEWYNNYENWYTRNDRAFFVNFWYAYLMAIDTWVFTKTETSGTPLIEALGSYALMSHYEFFAELYALYYDYDDPKRSVVPASIARWLDDNIGQRNPDNPLQPLPQQG